MRKQAGGLFSIFRKKPDGGGKVAAKGAAAKAGGISTMLSGIFSSAKKAKPKAAEKPQVPRPPRAANGRDPGSLKPRVSPPGASPAEPQQPSHQSPSSPPAFLQHAHMRAPASQQSQQMAGASTDPGGNFGQRDIRRERRNRS
jgi:hypothetical protein